MLVRDIMTTDVVTVGPETPVKEIAAKLLERRISAVPVLDHDGRIVGVVSEGDLLRRVEAGTERHVSSWMFMISGPDRLAGDYIKSHGRRAVDVMTRDVISVADDAPISRLAEIFETRRIKRVPVVRNGRLVGIASRSNLVQVLLGVADRAPPEPAPDDATLRLRLIDALKAEPWADVMRLHVEVENGIVHYAGVVGSPEERTALTIAAEGIAGVKGVRNGCGIIASIAATV